MDHTDALCREIAEALDVTPAELRAIGAVQERAAKLRDAIELLEAFQHLSGAEQRRRCIAYVRTEVHRSKAATRKSIGTTAFGNH
ncbi:hypothetical protein [Methylobacterium sp. NFXW15]|uniref:hypothetical protein n=1 Tax=Methylobacterium sp. NFXW15 TaxID=2819512 RepID=UPI003CF60200